MFIHIPSTLPLFLPTAWPLSITDYFISVALIFYVCVCNFLYFLKESKWYSLFCALFFPFLHNMNTHPGEIIEVQSVSSSFFWYYREPYSAVLRCCCCHGVQNKQLNLYDLTYGPFCLCLYLSGSHWHLRFWPLLIRLSSWVEAGNARYSRLPEDASPQSTCLWCRRG